VQQSLSKQIRELEESVGTPLFTRTTRTVALTAAGEALLAAARAATAALDAGVQAARDAAHGDIGVLRVGFGTGAALELTPYILDGFHQRYPQIKVELREYPLGDSSNGLADGRSDVALIRLPIATSDIDFEPLFVEPLVAGLCATHPLARQASVSVDDLLDEPVTAARSTDSTWRDYWTLAAHRDGHTAIIVDTGSHTEELELVAAGVACTITAAAAARYTPHPGVCYVPIHDAGGSTVAVAWRREPSGPLVPRFVEVARDVREHHPDIVRAIEEPAGPPAPS
jgi:DNA-binding transcriptional LysR family regulator